MVGSGPNGLAAAVHLARSGLRVQVLEAAAEAGGGARSAELTVPGLVHDTCSGVHPFGVGSPYFASLPLQRHGLRWLWPDIDLAHPLDDGSAGLMYRDLQRTAEGLGRDGPTWRRLFRGLSERFDDLAADILGPIVGVPRHPVLLARFGVRALAPATVLARLFRTDVARALWAGSAAHVFQPLGRPLTSSVGVMLTAAGHAYGWPVAQGGSVAIVEALVSLFEESGGRIDTGHLVRSRQDLPPARVVLLDTTPRAAAEILGSDLAPTRARSLRRFRYGTAAFKVDLAVRGGVPWRNDAVGRAGTVHLGGTIEDIAEAEAAITRGQMPERPFVLVAQQAVADPSRALGDLQPVYAYAHVPAEWDGDGETAVIDQIERFAPGTRERIVATSSISPAGFEEMNPNNVGGDIAGGATDPVQLIARPRLSPDPYSTGVPGVYLCSASTPPGAGVHGMCGYRAAVRALRWLEQR